MVAIYHAYYNFCRAPLLVNRSSFYHGILTECHPKVVGETERNGLDIGGYYFDLCSCQHLHADRPEATGSHCED
jgi:hypothetical protein